METTLAYILTYRYIALFPLALIEGPIVSFVAGILVALGYLSALPAFTILVLGDVLPDVAYYLFGLYGTNTKFMKGYLLRNKGASAHLLNYKKLWKNSPAKMMFMSKLAYGLSTLLLVSAGMVNLPIGKFFRLALIVTLFQYALLMYAGYHFGNALFAEADRYITYAGYAAAIFVTLFIALFIVVKRYAKKELETLS